MWQNKKVLIAGGQGFIGYNLALRLHSLGAIVTITEHSNGMHSGIYHDERGLEVIPCDLLKMRDCVYITHDKDYVFMCAAVSHGAKFIKENPLAMVTPNVIMNAQILDASYASGVKKFIFISSSAAYPDTKNIPTKEDDMFNGDPYNVYYAPGWMKRYMEIMCKTYTEKIKNGMQCIIIRPSNIFGEYDNFDPELSHVTAALIKKVAEHQNPLEVWGDGNDIRDIIYIDDFINMMLQATEKINNFNPINIAYGEAFSVKQILEFLFKIENFYPEVIYNSKKPSMIPVRKIDVSKSRELNIIPKFNIIDALSNTLNWYKQHYL